MVQPSALVQSSDQARLQISTSDSPLGKFVAFWAKNQSSEIRVHSVEAGNVNEVPRGVFSSVLQDAKLVDFAAVNKYGRDTLFVAKPHLWQSKEDIKALRRLGPRINLTIHDTQELSKASSMEVKVHLDNTDMLIMYGVPDPAVEKARLIRHAVKLMSRQMWAREKERLVTNRKNRGMVEPLSHNWSKAEKDQLLGQGYVDRYTVGLKVDLDKFPELAYDMNAYKFVKK